jgi:predicted nucleotidyltransferase
MKTLAEIKEILRAERPYLAEKYGVTVVGVFGSYVRGEQEPDSDIDILIELERPTRISLLGLVELEYYLSELVSSQKVGAGLAPAQAGNRKGLPLPQDIEKIRELLGTKVDVAIKKNLRKRIGKRILDEVVPV